MREERTMGEVLPFRKPGPRKLGLCQHGHHQWSVWQDKQFDVREGRLVTVYRCRRCGARKVKTI